MQVKFKAAAFIPSESWGRGGKDERRFSGRRVKAGTILDLPDEYFDLLPEGVEIIDPPKRPGRPKKEPAQEEK